jgi:hypothetical protein
MMRSKPFSMSSARSVLKFFFLLICAAGCSTSTVSTYTTRDLDTTFEKILKEEYAMDSHAVLVGKTFWAYLPIENLFEKTSGNDPKDKIKERFDIQVNESAFKGGLLSVDYLVKPVIPEQEKDQGYKLNKKAMEKINNGWEVMRRVIFSMDRVQRDEVQFYILMAADINNGLELRETIYYKDMIKVLYRVISPGEYHHRVPVKSGLAPEVIGNKTGKNIKFTDIGFNEFLCRQIEHRIGLKFQKPEVEQSADMDTEIRKIVIETLRTYMFADFQAGELTNLLTNGKTLVGQGDVRDLKPIR